jgi:hypothetical protein
MGALEPVMPPHEAPAITARRAQGADVANRSMSFLPKPDEGVSRAPRIDV